MLSTYATPFSTPANGRDIGLCDFANYGASGGGVYCFSNPTPGTGVAGHAAATTFDETKSLLYISNGGLRDIYLLSLVLRLTNAGTAGTTVRFTQTVDTGPRTPSTTITAAMTASKGGTGGQSGTGATVYCGGIVIPAASSGRQVVGDYQYRSVIGVVLDEYGFTWGATALPQQTATGPTDGTAQASVNVSYGPVRIPPGKVFNLHQWSASQSGAYQFEYCGYYAEI